LERVDDDVPELFTQDENGEFDDKVESKEDDNNSSHCNDVLGRSYQDAGALHTGYQG
jgi:hypothetical protein